MDYLLKNKHIFTKKRNDVLVWYDLNPSLYCSTTMYFCFQLTADAYEKDLQEALLQSKLEFEKTQQLVRIYF